MSDRTCPPLGVSNKLSTNVDPFKFPLANTVRHKKTKLISVFENEVRPAHGDGPDWWFMPGQV